MSADEILMDTEERMDQAVQHLAGELSGLRSGRASPALVDKLQVPAYGVDTPLAQLAQIGCPEPRQILIKPFDPSIIKDIEKAILASDLGLNPSSDGKVLRLNLPPLSEERRKQLAKVVKDGGEKANIAVRNVRRDANKNADAAQKDKDLTEDECERLKKEIHELDASTSGVAAVRTKREKLIQELESKAHRASLGLPKSQKSGVLVRDVGASDATLQLFVDGVGGVVEPGFESEPLSIDPAGVALGQELDSPFLQNPVTSFTTRKAHRRFIGSLDDVRIFRSALSSEKIAGLASTLAGWWTFNDLTPTAVVDWS